MSSTMLNPVSNIDAPSVPVVYALNAVALDAGLRPRTDGYLSDNDLNAQMRETLAADAASLAEPIASGDNGQMEGFVSYLNKGPRVHAETGSLDNLSSLFP